MARHFRWARVVHWCRATWARLRARSYTEQEKAEIRMRGKSRL